MAVDEYMLYIGYGELTVRATGSSVHRVLSSKSGAGAKYDLRTLGVYLEQVY